MTEAEGDRYIPILVHWDCTCLYRWRINVFGDKYIQWAGNKDCPIHPVTQGFWYTTNETSST